MGEHSMEDRQSALNKRFWNNASWRKMEKDPNGLQSKESLREEQMQLVDLLAICVAMTPFLDIVEGYPSLLFWSGDLWFDSVVRVLRDESMGEAATHPLFAGTVRCASNHLVYPGCRNR